MCRHCQCAKLLFVIVFSSAGIGVLIPHADGAGNDLLVGRYLQLGITFYTILSIPGAVMWALLVEEAILWFEFDQETATIGQQYAYALIMSLFLEGFQECFTEFLNTLDHETYATALSIATHGTSCAIVLAVAAAGVKDLVIVGLVEVSVGLLGIIVNLAIMSYKGWIYPYMEGLVRTSGLKVRVLSWNQCFSYRKSLVNADAESIVLLYRFKDGRAVRTVVVTAIPLSVAWLLTFGEVSYYCGCILQHTKVHVAK
jgi:MatE